MGGLIGTATTGNNGLISKNQAIRSISKDSNVYACLRIYIQEAGQIVNGILYVTNVQGVVSSIAVSAAIWNIKTVSCKLINGGKGFISSLSYKIETNSVLLFINMTAYASITFVPFSVYYKTSIEAISSIPSDAINVDF